MKKKAEDVAPEIKTNRVQSTTFVPTMTESTWMNESPHRRVCPLIFTFVGHHAARLEVHLGAASRADLVDVVAQLVAAVLSAAQAHSLVEGLLGVAAVGHALVLGVDQRVDEQVDGALVGALDQLVHVCHTGRRSTGEILVKHNIS